jgi:hypothetical protein
MATLKVHAGACGHSITITITKGKDKTFFVALDTECAMVKKMLEDIAVLDRFATLTGFQNNAVYHSAAKHLKHVACPVPSGILKALEIEAGLNVPKDVSMVFVRETK